MKTSAYRMAKMLINSGVAKENINAQMRAQMTEAERKDLNL